MKLTSLSLLSVIFLTTCSTPPSTQPEGQTQPEVQPTSAVVAADTSHPQHTEAELVNDEPTASGVELTPYDGTIDNAKFRVKEICAAADAKKISCNTYLYDNGSGADPINCLRYFSSDPTSGHNAKHQDWFLMMQGKEKWMEYFFDESKKIFAIVHFSVGEHAELLAEIFFNKDGSIMKGSWLQKDHAHKVDLSTYKGDYWYDFFEGYPYYPTTKELEKDKSLKYQQ
jgi:hypothetical protein